MILDNLLTKEDLKKELQSRYKVATQEQISARRAEAFYIDSFFQGVEVSCLKIAEKFGIKLEQE